MDKVMNPFALTTYRGPAYFCDREAETKQLTELMLNGHNITLFALRRLGKTGLIHHVFHSFSNTKKLSCIYLDIQATQNLAEFTNQLATAVYNHFPVEKSAGKKVMALFQRFRPLISFDELTGKPTISLSIENQTQKENSFGQILQFLDQQQLRIIMAIDEFQQILSYPETNTEALLRSHMQQLKNITFIFCGSNQQMMHEIFNSAKRPFFASTTNLSLGFINQEIYKNFIRQQFSANQRTIDDESLNYISQWTRLHTFYTQYFCSVLFTKNKKHTTIKDVYETAVSILNLNESTYFQYRNLLTSAQWQLLSAIAKEEQLFKPQSKAFIQKHKLGTPALVKRGLDALLKKEIIFHNTSVEMPYYEVYDKFLMRWLQYK